MQTDDTGADAQTETELLRRLAAGDPAALEEVYRANAGRCRGVAHRILGDETLARDAVQEAFLALWRHRDGLLLRSAGVRPWLIVVTRNAALNIARTGARRATRESAFAQSQTQVDETDAFTRLESGAEARRVRDALSHLRDDQRRVITLAYYGRHTLVEIAALTGAPLGTVKRRAQLALAHLAKALGARDL